MYQLAENRVLYAVEPHLAKDTVKNHVGTIDQNIADAGQHPFRNRQFLFARRAFLSEQVETGCRRSCPLSIHSLPRSTSSSTSDSSELTPIVTSSLYLPLCFSTTMTLVVPERFFFLRTNMIKQLASPKIE